MATTENEGGVTMILFMILFPALRVLLETQEVLCNRE